MVSRHCVLAGYSVDRIHVLHYCKIFLKSVRLLTRKGALRGAYLPSIDALTVII